MSDAATTTALAVQDEVTAAIMAAQEQEDEGEVTFRTPLLKLCQGLTKEVKEGNAEAGEFLNTLTGESLGTKVEFIVSYFQSGRSASSKDSKYFVSVGDTMIPAHWADLVGEEFVGTPFSEHPDAEEQYKRRVNAGEIEWGKGPLISTTYNYTGYVLDPAGEDEPMPVRVSFLRTTKAAHEKLQLLKKSLLRNKPFWDVVFEFSTVSKSFGRNDAFVVNVAKSRPTDSAEKQAAVELAQAVLSGRAESNDEAGQDKRVAPEAAGGLDV